MSYLGRNRIWSSERGSKIEQERLLPADLALVARLEEGYSFVPTSNTSKNVEISKKHKIGYVWSWLQGNDTFEGVGQLLEECKSLTKSRFNYANYYCQNRNFVLSVLGWPEPEKYKSILLKDRSVYSPIRSALISLCNFDTLSALESVKEIKTQEPVLYAMVKSFSFDQTKVSLHKASAQFSHLANSYVSALLLFMAGPSESSKVFEKLPFPDNLAFGCMFFSDQQLKRSYKKLLEEYRVSGDLNGLVISGFDSVGIEIIEKYLENTEDIQTVALIGLTAKSLSHPKFADWVSIYKAKLNNFELWNYRARLEIDERRMYRIGPDSYKTSKCLYCNSLLTYQNQEGDTWSEKDYGKKFISTCDTCPGSNNNLCCAVCCLPYNVFGQFDLAGNDDLFVWCENCNHAGHAEHLALWFAEYKTCPVVGCKCRCDQLANDF